MRQLLVLIAGIVTLFGVAACGGGGSSEPDPPQTYDFNGRWVFDERQVSSNCRWTTPQWTVDIVQSGVSVSATLSDVGRTPYSADGGICDPVEKTIGIGWANRGGGRSLLEGKGETGTTMIGTGYYDNANGCFLSTTWTAVLVFRP